MVHALYEAHRVLRPYGLLIDLRPARVHRRVGLMQDEGYRLMWVMRETFEDDLAADRAVTQVTREGRFKAVRTRFDCYRIMDTLEEFREWLADCVEKHDLQSHDWLTLRLVQALETSDANTRIVVYSPLDLRVLRKQEN